jgi:hypothetical protein
VGTFDEKKRRWKISRYSPFNAKVASCHWWYTTKRPKTIRSTDKTSRIQNVPRHYVPATKCPNYKTRQLQYNQSLRTYRLQNIPNTKRPNYNVPAIKHPTGKRTFKFKNTHIFMVSWKSFNNEYSPQDCNINNKA